MHEERISALESRIVRIELKNRWLTRGYAILALGAIGAMLVGFRNDVPSLIQARRIQILDNNNRLALDTGVQGDGVSGYLSLYGPEKVSVNLGKNTDGAGFVGVYAGNGQRVCLVSGTQTAGVIDTFTANGGTDSTVNMIVYDHGAGGDISTWNGDTITGVVGVRSRGPRQKPGIPSAKLEHASKSPE